jgi:hypothetical protein
MKTSKSNVVAVSRNKEAIETTICAIYTRQSSNTTTDLTSCQLQFEACESFIKAHAGRGWRRIEEDFNDEGWSGATLDGLSFNVFWQRFGMERSTGFLSTGGPDVTKCH